jgi:hypothetical protein
MNAIPLENRLQRLFLLVAAMLAGFGCTEAFADGTLRREALVESVNEKQAVKTVVFIIGEETKEKNAKPVKWDLAVEEGKVFQELANGRKVHVKFSALKPGQRVRVTALTPFGITGYNLAKEIIILPANGRH